MITFFKKNKFFVQGLAKKEKHGFTLVEALVFLFIFSVTVMAFYQTTTVGIASIIEGKVRVNALGLANEKMEVVRNLEYDKIGTVTGSPAVGNLPEKETVSKNGRNFYVATLVEYYQDAYDDSGGDSEPFDYKKVGIRVFWEDDNLEKSVLLTSTFAPPTIEDAYNGGILLVRAIDSLGQPISGALVQLINNSVLPVVNESATTNLDGSAFFTQLVPSDQTYSVQISKGGYFSINTYERTSSFEPVDVHASVVDSSISEKSMVTDKVSTIKIQSETPLEENVTSIEFSLRGGKKIGDPIPLPSDPFDSIYAYNQSGLNTGSGGEKVFNDMSFGTYFFTPSVNPNYEFVKIDSAVDKAGKFVVAADSNITAKALFAPKALPSLLANVLDITDDSVLTGKEVRLERVSPAYDLTLTTDQLGQVYFPDKTTPLENDIYDLSINISGFQPYSESVTINGLTEKEIKLTPS